MDLSDELRVLLARLHALEYQFVALDDRLAALEHTLDEHEQRLQRLEPNKPDEG